jgi:hypothetical protein
MLVDLTADMISCVDFPMVDVVITPGPAALTEPPANSPYPANAKLSRSVSLRVGSALTALSTDPPKLVAGDRHRFSLLV